MYYVIINFLSYKSQTRSANANVFEISDKLTDVSFHKQAPRLDNNNFI